MLPAQKTTEIEYRANLASFPFTAIADPNIPNSERLNPAYFRFNPDTASVVPSSVTGISANLLPDAAAVYSGTVDLSALSVTSNSTLVLNGTSIAINAGDDATVIQAAIGNRFSMTDSGTGVVRILDDGAPNMVDIWL